MDDTPSSKKYVTMGNVLVPLYEPLDFDVVTDDVRIAPQPVWPRLIGAVSILLGISGLVFLPPAWTLPAYAPRVVGAGWLFPDWYVYAAVTAFAAGFGVHALLLIAGVVTVLRRRSASAWTLAWIVIFSLYTAGVLGAFSLGYAHADLAALSPSASARLLGAWQVLRRIVLIECIWPLFLTGWFIRKRIRGEVRQWKVRMLETGPD